MLSRDFDFSTITDITSSLKDKFSSLDNVLPNMSSVKGLVASKASNMTGINVPNSNNSTMNNQTADILNKLCANKSVGEYNEDYIRNLERRMGIKNNVNICSNSQVSELDRILMASTALNTSKKSEYKTLINKAIGNEMSEMGYSGSIPSCLYGKVESLIDKLLSGLNGNVNLKLDLLNMFNNDCLNDSLGAIGNSNLKTKIGSLMTDSMLNSGNENMAVGFLGNKFSNDQNSAMNILGNSLSTNNNGDNSGKKLMLYNAMTSNSNVLNTTNINKLNLANNLNNDTTINKNSKGIFESMSSVFNTNDSVVFKNKNNINNVASSYIANKKSNDSLSTLTKSSNLNLGSVVKLSNLFG